MLYKRIVVTGGSGLVGSHMQKILPQATYLSRADYDLTIQEEAKQMYSRFRPDCVIHLAARVGGIIDNMKHPYEYFEQNILMNTFVLKYAREAGAKKFLGILSSCIFPDVVNDYPMGEALLHAGPPTQTNFSYGMAKRALAIQIDSCNEEYGTKYNYISPCNLYGESDKTDESKSHFVTALVKKICVANHNGDSCITLYGDGSPMRQFMHAADIANIIKIIIEKDITESFNVATTENMSIDDIARIALRATNSEHLQIIYDKTKPNGQLRKDLNIKKFQSLIPDYKFISLESGIKNYYNVLSVELGKQKRSC